MRKYSRNCLVNINKPLPTSALVSFVMLKCFKSCEASSMGLAVQLSKLEKFRHKECSVHCCSEGQPDAWPAFQSLLLPGTHCSWFKECPQPTEHGKMTQVGLWWYHWERIMICELDWSSSSPSQKFAENWRWKKNIPLVINGSLTCALSLETGVDTYAHQPLCKRDLVLGNTDVSTVMT